jgi:hypothetical protein
MSTARAVRYRKLALATKDRADADLLVKLADECDRGFSARLNGFRRGHTSKMRRHQRHGLSSRTKKAAGANRKARDRSFGNHSLTIVKHCFKTGLELDDSTQRGTKCSFSSSPPGCFLRSSRRRCYQFDLILKPIIDATDIAAPDGLPLMSWSAPWAAKQYLGSTKARDASRRGGNGEQQIEVACRCADTRQDARAASAPHSSAGG